MEEWQEPYGPLAGVAFCPANVLLSSRLRQFTILPDSSQDRPSSMSRLSDQYFFLLAFAQNESEILLRLIYAAQHYSVQCMFHSLLLKK